MDVAAWRHGGCSVVDQLGGRIELESEPGRGAAFTVTLPRATPAVVPRAA